MRGRTLAWSFDQWKPLEVEEPEVARTQEDRLQVALLFMADPSVEDHTLSLALLRLGGIVDRRRQGKNYFYYLTGTGYRLSKIVEGLRR